MCCPDGCLDSLDPYRLPCIPADRINLPFTRPDLPLNGRGPAYIYSFQNFGITQINPPDAWQPDTRYERGDSITPLPVDDDATPLPQTVFVCIVPGTSGSIAPRWPVMPGALVGNFNYLVDDTGATVHQANVLISDHPTITEALVTDVFGGDGTIAWLCTGLFIGRSGGRANPGATVLLTQGGDALLTEDGLDILVEVV